MSQAEALSIVIDMARRVITHEKDNASENTQQTTAINTVEGIWVKICNGSVITDEDG